MNHGTSRGAGRGLKVAILGGGMIANIHRRSAILAGAEILGVLDRTHEASLQLAASWGVPRGFASIDEVLESPVDVIHVCTPNATHHGFVMAALSAGKHVVCEKPLGVSAGQAIEMQQEAERAGVVGVVPFVYRYHPLVREIRGRRIAGEFGPWNLIHGTYLQDWMLSPSATSWRVDPNLNGASRAFADIGSHWCDLMEWVSGERIVELSAAMSIAIPKRYQADGATFSGASGAGALQTVSTEDSVVFSFRTANGVLGSATISQVAAGRKNRLWFEMDGARASAVFDQENPETIWLGREEGASLLFRNPNVGDPDQRRLAVLPAGHPQGFAHCFELFVADTYEAIRGGDPTGLPTFRDGLRSMRIIDAAVQSAAGGTWTEVIS